MTATARRPPESTILLPLHLKWSGPRDYDLSDLRQRCRVYEIVLREGTAADVRTFIDPDELLRLWNVLVLPPHVRTAWADFFQRTRGVAPCPRPEVLPPASSPGAPR